MRSYAIKWGCWIVTLFDVGPASHTDKDFLCNLINIPEFFLLSQAKIIVKVTALDVLLRGNVLEEFIIYDKLTCCRVWNKGRFSLKDTLQGHTWREKKFYFVGFIKHACQ